MVKKMADTLDILLRILLGFIILLVLVRIIGNKQLGQLNVFTYISGIVIGSMTADIILHKNLNFWSSMLGVAAWVGLVFCVEIASMKSVKARELLDGQPIILIKKGKIIYDALKKERLNIDDLTMVLRTNQVFSILDVEYAILEPNGDLSVLKKSDKSAVTKENMDALHKQCKHIPTSIIMDGKAVIKNLEELDLSEEWLDSTLKKLGVRNRADVLYAELQEDGELYIQVMDE